MATNGQATGAIPLQISQPMPLDAWVIPVVHGGVQVGTVVWRQWAEGATTVCRLCMKRRCSASRGGCVLYYNRVVTREEAYTISDDGYAWDGAPAEARAFMGLIS